MIRVERVDDANAECVVKGTKMEIGAELLMIFKSILMKANDEYGKKLLADWLHMLVNIAYEHFDELVAEVVGQANTDAENYFNSILGDSTESE